MCSSLCSPELALNENLVAVEKCSLRVELPGKTIRTLPNKFAIKTVK